MPNLVVSHTGECFLQDVMLRTALAVDQTWHVHGYTNDYDPLGSETLADFTEVALPGYTPKGIDRSLWPPAVSVDGQGVSVYGGNPVLLTCTSGAAEVFGYYVTDETDTVLLWAEAFDTSQTLNPLHPVQVRLTMATRSQSEPT